MDQEKYPQTASNPPPYAVTYSAQGYPPPQQGYPQGPQQGYPQGQPYPQGPQQGYHPQGYPQGQQQPAQTTVIVQQQPRPSNYLALSCIVYWCCNCLFGGIAFGFSMASSSAADDGDMETARSHGNTAKWLSIVGIIISVILFAILIILYVTGAALVASQIDDFEFDFDN